MYSKNTQHHFHPIQDLSANWVTLCELSAKLVLSIMLYQEGLRTSNKRISENNNRRFYDYDAIIDDLKIVCATESRHLYSSSRRRPGTSPNNAWILAYAGMTKYDDINIRQLIYTLVAQFLIK